MPFRRSGRARQSPLPPRSDPSSEPITEVLKDLLEELQSRKVPPRPPRDWIQISVTALPGLAAAIALFFTWLSIIATTNASNSQLQIAEQGQLTDRYNSAIANLGSSSVDVRLGGIYALQRIMQDSPRDQPTIVAVLCAFVRDHANTATATSAHPSVPSHKSPISDGPSTDIQAALTVVDTRDTNKDSSTTVVNLAHAYLANADLSGAKLSGADLSGADLSGATLLNADLSGAKLIDADLYRVDRSSVSITTISTPTVNLSGANLSDARLSFAALNRANLTDANLTNANLTGVDLVSANLTRTELNWANLSKAFLVRANATQADFSCAQFSSADFSHANLSDASFGGVDLTGRNVIGADLANINKSRVTCLRVKLK